MYGIARQVLKGRRNAPKMPDDPAPDVQRRAIRAALELAYAERPARDAVLDAARAALVATTSFVREKQIVTVPDEPLEIIEMPEFQQGVALAYCDSPGALEAGQKTFYAVSPIPKTWTKAQTDSFLREYNTRSIQDLTVHEAMPGHYLQLAHANKYPSPLRAVLASGPFIEGWAVYAEKVMVEEGYMNGDPLMRLIQLKWYVRSVANALLDQAVHVDGMSREAAVRFLTRRGFPGRARGVGQVDARAAHVGPAARVLRRRARARGAARGGAAARRRRVRSQGVSRPGVVVRVAAGAVRPAAHVRSADRIGGRSS